MRCDCNRPARSDWLNGNLVGLIFQGLDWKGWRSGVVVAGKTMLGGWFRPLVDVKLRVREGPFFTEVGKEIFLIGSALFHRQHAVADDLCGEAGFLQAFGDFTGYITSAGEFVRGAGVVKQPALAFQHTSEVIVENL